MCEGPLDPRIWVLFLQNPLLKMGTASKAENDNGIISKAEMKGLQKVSHAQPHKTEAVPKSISRVHSCQCWHLQLESHYAAFGPAPWSCAWARSNRWPNCLGPRCPCGRCTWSPGLVVLTLSILGCCSHLVNDPVDGRFFFSLPPFLSN